MRCEREKQKGVSTHGVGQERGELRVTYLVLVARLAYIDSSNTAPRSGIRARSGAAR